MGEDVKRIDEILLPKYLGGNRKIVECDTKRLTAPGENYGSLMLAIDIKIKDNVTGKEHVMHTVAKAVPRNKFIQKMFKTPLTFKKELEFYRTIVPVLQDFQREHGIEEVMDFFPEFYGGRMGLNTHSDEFDDDAVILLENLKPKGYFCIDRTIGFDFDTAKYILKDLAIFHAVPLALKLKEPKIFKEKVLPHIKSVKVFDEVNEDTVNAMLDGFVNIAKENEDCAPAIPTMKQKLFNSSEFTKHPPEPREPFSTLIHVDFWVNNNMIKTEGGKVLKNKIVDFQMPEYGSPARDLIFFIFTSIQSDLVVQYYDHFVEFYHQNFIDNLKQFNVDTEQFSLTDFKEEIDLVMQELVKFQCFIMLKPLFATHDNIKELDNMNEVDLIGSNVVSKKQKEKLWMLVKEFYKRKWL